MRRLAHAGQNALKSRRLYELDKSTELASVPHVKPGDGRTDDDLALDLGPAFAAPRRRR
jgi:hypothetical protein